MSIVFSAIVPHSPLLIPSIGKENLKRLKNTLKAFNKLEEDLYSSQPETIIIISPHGVIQTNAFSMNLNPAFTANFEEFGDFNTKLQFAGNIGFAYKVREKLETNTPLQLISEPKLDHGTSVPLYMLATHLPQIMIIPIYYSGLDLEAHFKFGQLLKNELLARRSRVAVIASGELSHRLKRESPAGYSAKGKKFDQKLIDYLINSKVDDILGFDPAFISEVSECGLKSIVTLLGIMHGIKHEPQMLSYEYPFGIGYLTMNFKL